MSKELFVNSEYRYEARKGTSFQFIFIFLLNDFLSNDTRWARLKGIP